jgi:hypothetical protein
VTPAAMMKPSGVMRVGDAMAPGCAFTSERWRYGKIEDRVCPSTTHANEACKECCQDESSERDVLDQHFGLPNVPLLSCGRIQKSGWHQEAKTEPVLHARAIGRRRRLQ